MLQYSVFIIYSVKLVKIILFYCYRFSGWFTFLVPVYPQVVLEKGPLNGCVVCVLSVLIDAGE